MDSFSHLNEAGKARMVDVGAKQVTRRQARASAVVQMQASTVQAITDNQIAKGEVLAVARLAGIMGAKQTPNLIPLCHPIGLDSIEVDFEIGEHCIRVIATTTLHSKTGVEMEALTAVSVAALTIYDMCKSLDREMSVSNIQLDEKTGGKSGSFNRSGDNNGKDDA